MRSTEFTVISTVKRAGCSNFAIVVYRHLSQGSLGIGTRAFGTYR